MVYSPIPWSPFLPRDGWRRLGWIVSEVCKLVATLVKTTVRPVWSCGTSLGGMVRLVFSYRQNQTHTRLSAKRESGATVTCGELTVKDWRKSKTALQSSAMVAKVLAVACFVLPIFVVFYSSDSTPPSLLLSLSSSSSPLSSSPSSTLFVTERAKIFRIPLRTTPHL